MPHHIDVDIRRARSSDIDGMVSIFYQAFYRESGGFARLMCPESSTSDKLSDAAEAILKKYLGSQHSEFFVAYEASDDREPDADLAYGWISVSIVDFGTAQDAYVASEFTDYTSSEVLRHEENRSEDDARAEDDSRADKSPRAELLEELGNESKIGQDACGCSTRRYAVVNALSLDPECHRDTSSEMAKKLLSSAVKFAERERLQIWTQIPVNQKDFFRRAGFTEVRTVTLDLDYYKPAGSSSDLGTKTWVQLVYSPVG